MEEPILDDVLNLIRDQKHDFLNHLQVIMGNLQLDKKEKALDYLRQTTSSLLEAGPLTKLDNARLSIMLMKILQNGKNAGLDLVINFETASPSCKYYRKETIDFLSVVFDTVISYVSKASEGDNWLKVNFRQNTKESVWEMTMAPIIAHGSLSRALKKQQLQAGAVFSTLALQHQLPGQAVVSLTVPRE